MKMADIAQIHAKLKDTRPLSAFYKTAGCKAVSKYLRDQNLSDEEIMRKVGPHRGQPAQCTAHPLVVLEYLRWACEPQYFGQLEKLMVRQAAAAAPETLTE